MAEVLFIIVGVIFVILFHIPSDALYKEHEGFDLHQWDDLDEPSETEMSHGDAK